MNNLNRLKDIYPIESISQPISANYSSNIILSIILICIIIGLVKFKTKKDINKKELTLKDIDFNRDITKEKLYKFTKVAKTSIKTVEQEKELKELLKSIEKYKYRKNTPNIDKNIVKQIQRYIEKWC